jgi:hypothetical protein
MPRVKAELSCFSWNIQGTRREGVHALFDSFDQKAPGWDIICIQEGYSLDSDSWEGLSVGSRHHVLVVAPTSYHLDGTRRKGSVMVGIHARWKFNLQGEPAFSGQHLRVDLSVGGVHFSILSSHLPTRKFSSVAYRASLAQLALLWPTNREAHILWGVDGNAAIRRESDFCGPGGAEAMSSRGEILREFAVSHLVFPASCATGPDTVITRTGNSGQHAHLRDYMFFSDSDRRACVGGGALSSCVGLSDHLPTFATLRADQVWHLRRPRRHRLHKWEPICDDAFKKSVGAAMEILGDVSVGSFVTALGHCARAQHKPHRSGLSRPITARVQAAQALLREADGQASILLARRHLRGVQECEAGRLLRLRSALACKHSLHKAWGERRISSWHSHTPLWRIRDSAGSLHVGASCCMEQVAAFFTELARNRSPLPADLLASAPTDDMCMLVEPSRVQKCLNSLRGGTATVDENINVSVLKHLPTSAVDILAMLLSQMLNNRATDRDVEQLMVVDCLLLRKVPSPQQTKDFRPISLIPAVLKLYEMVLDSYLEEHEVPEDPFVFGFRPGKQCADWSWTLQQLLERASGYQQPIYVAKVDVSKAFDSVELSRISRAMQRRLVPLVVVAAYMRLLVQVRVTFRLDSGQTDGPHSRLRGVWQGGRASPRLYRWCHNDTMAPLLQKWEDEGQGFQLLAVPSRCGNKWTRFYCPAEDWESASLGGPAPRHLCG